MYDDKNRNLEGFDSAVPMQDGQQTPAADTHGGEQDAFRGHTADDRQTTQADGRADDRADGDVQPQGYTVTPAGGYYNHDSHASDAKATPDADQPAAAPASTEYHYSAAKGDIPFAGSEEGDQKAQEGSYSGSYSQSGADGWQQRQSADYDASGRPAGNSYTPPQYGFMPSGNYGYQNGYTGQQPPRPQRPVKTPKPKKEKKPAQKHFTARAFIACALAAAVIGAGAGAGGFALTSRLYEQTDDTASTASSSSTGTAQTISIQGEVENLVQAVAEKVGPSVVGIRTTAASIGIFGSQGESTGEGSGIIYTQDGYIITNYHVIQAAAEQAGMQSAKVEVYLPSDTENGIEAKIVGYNISYDLAVLKIDKTGLPAAEFGNSDDLSVGQYVVAIGNPGGLDFMGSVTYGVISGLNRKITTENSEQLNLIQTDAAINPGNSGGALVNSKGQVIGVNSVKLVSSGYESMGFAIPINQVIETCQQIISKENEPTPYLGLEISTTYDAQTLQMLGYPTGAVVQNVTSGGPAAEAGIQRGDIITEFNDTTISSYTTLNSAISQCSPGEQVTLTIYRSGRYYEATVTLGSNNVNTIG